MKTHITEKFRLQCEQELTGLIAAGDAVTAQVNALEIFMGTTIVPTTRKIARQETKMALAKKAFPKRSLKAAKRAFPTSGNGVTRPKRSPAKMKKASATMRTLEYMKAHGGRAQWSELHKALKVPTGTVSGSLAKLAKRGLVKRDGKGVWSIV